MQNDFNFDGKKYISARRASQITGYTSDYIGQLCRSMKLDCRVVGRSWFVSEISIMEHRNASSKKKTLIANLEPKEQSPDNVKPATDSKNEVKIEIQPDVPQKYFIPTKSVRQSINKALSLMLIVFIFSSMFFLFFGHVALDQTVLFTKKSYEYKSSQLALLSAGKIYETTINIKNKAGDLFSEAYVKLSYIFNPSPLISKKNNDLKIGIAVAPSTGSKSENEKLKQRIKNSFSDEVEIITDDVGGSGIIRPVFKKQTDEEYVYVLTPIKSI